MAKISAEMASAVCRENQYGNISSIGGGIVAMLAKN
jgi:hypothetical protein